MHSVLSSSRNRDIVRQVRVALASLTLVGMCLSIFGCRPSAPSSSRADIPVANTGPVKTNAAVPKVYEVGGEFKEANLAKRVVRIAHDEIPGYMRKMTMEFELRDSSDLTQLKVGDRVTFQLKVTDEDGWIESLKRVSGPAPTPSSAVAVPTNSPASRPKIAPSEPLFPGDLLPDYAFTNQLGRPVLLSQYEGQAIAFTFIFTTCPFPTMCPRMSANFQKAYETLNTSTDTPTNWHFFSITIDPATDTPSVLQSYGTRLQYDPNHWSFLTGEESQIELLARHFGLNFYRESGALNHNLRTVVVNPQGKVHKILIGNEWKPAELVEEIRAALASKKPN